MKKYLELYTYFKQRITDGQLVTGDRLPSIRKTADLFSVSTTTVENAFFALQAEGYILPSPKRGFFVSYRQKTVPDPEEQPDTAPAIRFDLKSGESDPDSFDIRLWHRYINSALRQEERLCSYSEVQGEEDLRIAVADYIREKRNVITSPDRIVIGAGVQSLLNILASLLGDRSTISFPDLSFTQGTEVFESRGFDVHIKDKDADIIYVSPSHMTRYGKVMPISRRMELVEYSRANGSYVLEDDFDNDFLYSVRPTPSLYTLATTDNIVYISSFANVLTPGIRISFMVLPDTLLKRFRERSACFAQTASKTEQIALCGYLRDGHIAAQIRKIRRSHTGKVRQFRQELQTVLPEADCVIGENGLQIRLTAPFRGDPDTFEERGISVIVDRCDPEEIELILIPSSLKEEELTEAACLLAEIIKSEE